MNTRLFLALELPEPARDAILELGSGVPGAYWCEEDQLHLTLRFLGDADGLRREALVRGLERTRLERFHLVLKGIGFFPLRGTPESLWLGVERNPVLDGVQSRVDAAATRAGFEKDRHKWSPHVTIARLDEAPESRLVRFATEHALFRVGPFEVDRLTLFSSHRRIWGSEYKREQVFPLASPARSAAG
jgi:2'-5' RNA ligase